MDNQSPNAQYQQPQPQVVYQQVIIQQQISEKSMVAAALLCFFLGYLGIHRFYVGKIGTGILWLLTAGWFGIGTLIDFIVILCENFRDGRGLVIKCHT